MKIPNSLSQLLVASATTMMILGTSSCALVAGQLASRSAKSDAAKANAADANADSIPLPKGTGPRKRIGIVDFEDTSGGRGGSLATIAADTTAEVLVKSEAFIVIERAQIAAVLKEQGFGMTGAINPQSAAKAGQLLGLQALVVGKVLDYDEGTKRRSGMISNSSERKFTARVSLKMIDATTGEVWVAESADGVARETSVASSMGGGSQTYDKNLGKRALHRAVRKAAAALVIASNKKPWSASVAKVSKNQIYVVAGRGSGLTAGSELQVRQLGDEITDPTTGQMIGREEGEELGVVTVSKHINEKLTLCKRESGGRFHEGDVVSIIAPKS